MGSQYLGPWRIDVEWRDGVEHLVPAAALARTVAAALDAAGAPRPASIGLILADDAELAGLNAEHMGKDGPTDVLSFPLLPPDAFPPHPGREHRRRRSPGSRSRCRPAAGRISGTSSYRSSGPSSRRPRVAAARPVTCAGTPATSCACS